MQLADLVEKSAGRGLFSPGLTMMSLLEYALVVQWKRAEKKRGNPFSRRAARQVVKAVQGAQLATDIGAILALCN